MRSKLATVSILSPNHSWGRTHEIDTITPHYMAGDLSVEGCGNLFKNPNRQASSNYGIGSDGRIGLYVEEENRPWTSGSRSNDNRAITFECANLRGGVLTDACWKSLVNLTVDICQRYGFDGVYYCGAADYSRLPRGKMMLTMHKWFQDTDCPGPWLSTQFERLRDEVNAKLRKPDPIIEEEEDDMNCLISIKNRNTVVWFDGGAINDLTSPEDIAVLKKVYKSSCNGKEMPRLELTEEEFARLCQSVKGGYPAHLQALVDKYPTRSPEK